MDANHWQQIAAYMALTPEQRRAADRAKFKYLPTPGLLEQAGYWEEFIGLWQYRPPGLTWPLYEVAFYSKSGGCGLFYADKPGCGWQRSGIWATVATDEQLVQLLRTHDFPIPTLSE